MNSSDKKIEVLVAAMHQQGFSLIKEMNLHTHVVIGNQTDYDKIESTVVDSHRLVLVSTKTRGVGVNRNLALEFSEGDILLFGDQDCIYENNIESIILKAFNEYPQADVMIFGIQFTKNGKLYQKRLPGKGKMNFWKSLKYGTCSIAIKKSTLQRYNLHFTELFGGGCIYSHGEDSDFILQCFKKHLKVYSYNEIICTTSKDTSTCFEGYTKKYYYDVGALARHSFGVLALPYMLYIALRTKNTEVGFGTKVKMLLHGYKGLDSITSYNEYIMYASDFK